MGGAELQLLTRYFGQLGPHLAPVTIQAARHVSQAVSRAAAFKRQPATKPLSDGALLEEYFCSKHASAAKGEK